MHTYLAKIDFENNKENQSNQYKALNRITNSFSVSHSNNCKDFDLVNFDSHIIFSNSRFENLAFN